MTAIIRRHCTTCAILLLDFKMSTTERLCNMLCYCCPPAKEPVTTIQLTCPTNGETVHYAEIRNWIDSVEEFQGDQIGYIAVTRDVYESYVDYRQWVATQISQHEKYAITQDPVLVTMNMNDWSLLIRSGIVASKYTLEYIADPCSHSATGFVMVGIGVLGDIYMKV